MIALCVDDETLLLEDLKRAVEKSPDICQVEALDDPFEAAEWALEHPFDIAFLDVRMPVMSGIELADQLHQIRPGVPIIFCTGYREHALDAFRAHASGYLLKPIRAEKVQEEIDHIKALQGGFADAASAADTADTADRIFFTVRPYGGFTVQDAQGRPIRFHRSKEKELFAALIHRDGREISTEDLCGLLWEDNAWMYEKNKQYLYTLFSYLRSTLREVGADDILTRGGSGYSLDMERIRIDETGKGKQEYLPGYAWSKQQVFEK